MTRTREAYYYSLVSRIGRPIHLCVMESDLKSRTDGDLT